jgi:16S rRNA (cytosine967-C5)-methyltransferase
MSEASGVSPPLADVLATSARAWSDFVTGQSIDRAIAATVPADRARLRAAVQDTTYSAIRRRALSERVIAELASRPPAPETGALLCVALPQLMAGRHATHTVVDQAVVAARMQPATVGAAGFVNAILRNFLRRQDELLERLQRIDEVRYNAPAWWIDAVRTAHPERWREILATGFDAPALVLRVNRRRGTVEDYLQCLAAQELSATRVGLQAVWLQQAVPVARIPGFAAGDVSVQDAGAQLAGAWLDVADGMRVLDACAAPGGKTAHLAELADLDLTALETDKQRAPRIEENLRRIDRRANLIVADGRDVPAWWDGRPYDRILVDAPCTASGIVRRHPDIPWLRRKADVAHLATLQAQLLEALWPLLGVGGRLLYVVCSVFPQEGSEQIARFVGRHPEAAARLLPGGMPFVQLLPSVATGSTWDAGRPWPTIHDGFFYALLEKSR